MAGTREYKIVINGVQESINALDALVAKAEELGRKLSGGITVDVKPQVQQPQQANTSQSAEKTFTVQAKITAEIEKQNTALSQQTSIVSSQSSSYKDALDVATSILGTYEQNIAKLAEYDAKLKEIASQKKAVQDIGVENEQTRQIMQELLADEIKYKQLKSETASILKTETKLLQAEEGSYDQMSAAVGRLRDALRASSGNLSPEQFATISQAVSTLDQELKDADKQVGNFFRNVGNYQSAAEGFSKIKVEIAGITQEFDGAKPAIMSLKNAMSQLAVEGKADTEEYKALADQMRNLQLAMVTVNDEINRSKDASAGLHDTIEMIQGFTAIATIGQGFSQLFGMDDSELGEQIKKMTTLMGILQGLNELKNQMATGTGIGPALNKLMDMTGLNSSLNQLKTSFSELMTGLKSVRTQSEVTAVGFDIMAASARVASAAVKSLWRALVVGLVIEAVVWLVEGLVDGIKALYNMVHDYVSVADDAEAANKALAHSYELVTQQINYYNEARDNEVARGDISKELAEMEKMLNIQQQLSKFAGVTEGSFMLNAENADITPVLHQYDEFEQRIQAINEKNEQGLKIGDDMDKLYNDVLADLAARWLEVDKNDQQAIEGFMEWYKQAPLYQQAVKWAIDTGDDAMKQFGNTINDVFNDVGALIGQFNALNNAVLQATSKLREELELRETYGKNWRTEQRVRQSNKEVDESRLTDGEKAKLKADREKEIRDSENHGRKQVSVAKRTNNDLLNLERQLQQDKLAIMRDGLTKTLATIEYERRRRLEAIDKMSASESKKEEARAAAKARYDHEEEEARRKFREQYEREEKEFNERVERIRKEAVQSDYEFRLKRQESVPGIGTLNKRAINDTLSNLKEEYAEISRLEDLLSTLGETLNNTEKNINEFAAEGIDNEELKKQFDTLVDIYNSNYNKWLELRQKVEKGVYLDNEGNSPDKSKTNTEFIWEQYVEQYSQYQKYYGDLRQLVSDNELQVLNIKKKYADDTFEYNYKKTQEELNTEREALKKRYDSVKDDTEAIAEIEKSWRKGLVDEYTLSGMDYDSAEKKAMEQVFDIHQWYYDSDEKLRLAYDSKMAEMVKAHNQEITQIETESKEKRQKAADDYWRNNINSTSQFLSRLYNLQDKSREESTDDWGFFNISKFRKDRELILNEYNLMINVIKRQITSLNADLAAGEISLGDFDRSYTELMDQLNNLINKKKELDNDNGMEDFMKGVDTWVQQIGQAANQILSAVFDYRNSEFERMQEELDKQIELVQQKYNEMEELAQRHKDNMSEIEDELTTARGDRRQHLIDALSAEIDAQRRALAEQKKAEKEKEKLEKQSDKLELQRKKEQKRQSLITAIINAALAISQAAANKWPVPAIPLMAVAAAVGAAQVASISAQKYAKGGLLQGPSHERGGIKVGGGIEVEGGEFVTNKGTTSKNLDLLYYINSSRKRLNVDDFIEFYSKGGGSKPLLGAKGKFADGGLMPSLEVASRTAEVIVAQDDRPVVVSVVDINNAQARVRRVQTMAGLER